MPAKDISPSEAAAALGRIRSEKKAAASRLNAQKARDRKSKPLSEIPCNCGGKGLNHKSRCPRGRAIYRRKKAGEKQSP